LEQTLDCNRVAGAVSKTMEFLSIAFLLISGIWKTPALAEQELSNRKLPARRNQGSSHRCPAGL